MNLVELIEGQLTGETIGKLSSLAGESEAKTQSAVGAVVPSLLAGLSGLASKGGAGKLVSALSSVTSESHGNPSEVLAAQPSQVLEKGNNLLGSLFGENAVGGIVGALSKFTGIGASGVKNLLSYVTPVALAEIGGEYFKGKTPTVQGLSTMFAEQKDNIAHALPAGLSLDSVLGSRGATDAYKAARAAVPTAAGSALPRWLLPLIGLALLGAVLWYALSPSRHVTSPTVPAVPAAGQGASETAASVTQLGKDLTGVIGTATTSLSGITDASSAEAALPQLQGLSAKLDGIKSVWDKLPESGRSSIASIASTGMGKVKDLAGTVEEMPGVGEKLKPVLDEILNKLSALST